MLLILFLLRSWKYWHSAMNHGKGFGIAISYDVCLECATGSVNPDWKIDKPIDFYRWREKLAMQKLKCDPKKLKYPGDFALRNSTQVPRRNRSPPRRPAVAASSSDESIAGSTCSGVSKDTLVEELDSGRLCGHMGDLCRHIQSVQSLPNKGHLQCVVCGKQAHQICGVCKMAMHYTKPPKENPDYVPCFFKKHDIGYLGLARDDFKITGKRKKDWEMASPTEYARNVDQVKRLHHEIQQAKMRDFNSVATTPQKGTPLAEVAAVAATDDDHEVGQVFLRNGRQFARM